MQTNEGNYQPGPVHGISNTHNSFQLFLCLAAVNPDSIQREGPRFQTHELMNKYSTRKEEMLIL